MCGFKVANSRNTSGGKSSSRRRDEEERERENGLLSSSSSPQELNMLSGYRREVEMSAMVSALALVVAGEGSGDLASQSDVFLWGAGEKRGRQEEEEGGGGGGKVSESITRASSGAYGDTISFGVPSWFSKARQDNLDEDAGNDEVEAVGMGSDGAGGGEMEEGPLDSRQWTRKWTVVVRNELSHHKKLFIHCKSADDDLGGHWLGHWAERDWSFKQNFWETTLFWCFMRKDDGHSHASFDVFWDDPGRPENKGVEPFFIACGYKRCLWVARDNGIYLLNHFSNKETQFRHAWKS
ncbi:hypothetical protein Vadar_001199 [Vaccinium darrowii]|uniref:Uncharacterized protein n=1 Tax=Vaccinium darrowii TaxID=229202 RepID=A0ACB7YSM6_9ERIC|nr:hypothetical protein Vadar_001199 [Vaccinium darrowii]